MCFLILVELANLLLVVLLEAYFLSEGLSRLATICVVIARCRMLANLYLLVSTLATDFPEALLLHHLNGLIEFIGSHFLALVIIHLFGFLVLQVNDLVLSDIVLLLLVGQHLIEQLLDLLAVLTLAGIVLLRPHLEPSCSPIGSFEPVIAVGVVATGMDTAAASSLLEIMSCSSIGHQDVITALVALVGFTKLVYLFESLGLFVFLSIQARMHVQVRYLLLGVNCHVLVLFNFNFLIDVEH